MTCARRRRRFTTTSPASFTPWIWKTCLARSRPIVVVSMWMAPLGAVRQPPPWHDDAVRGPSTPSDPGARPDPTRPADEEGPRRDDDPSMHVPRWARGFLNDLASWSTA